MTYYDLFYSYLGLHKCDVYDLFYSFHVFQYLQEKDVEKHTFNQLSYHFSESMYLILSHKLLCCKQAANAVQIVTCLTGYLQTTISKLIGLRSLQATASHVLKMKFSTTGRSRRML